MRTATTLAKDKTGWRLLYGPDFPADKQSKLAKSGNGFTEGVTLIQWQPSDGPARTFSKAKTDAVAAQLKAVAAKPEAKAKAK